MLTNKVVARFKNGEVKKGTTRDFSPNKVVFHLQLFTGEALDVNIEELKAVHFVNDLEISIEELKAVFFVKDFEGNKDHQDDYTDDIPDGGVKVQIEFSDGEMIIGYTQGYSAVSSGFFLIPADFQNNNDHIYVINSATEKVTLL